MQKRAWFSAIALTAILIGCGDDPVNNGGLPNGWNQGQDPATGDGDGAPGDGDSTWPVGDGDSTWPVGDGDGVTGDGDGVTGDGDGVTGDGDGVTGDGDGDGVTGDGDGSGGTGFIRGPAPTTASASKPGSYKVENTTTGFRKSTAYAEGTLYWPTDAEPPFAFVSVVPGFLSPQSSTQPWGPFLASHGIVVLTIGTNSGADQPPARATALLDALKTIAEENTRSASPLFGKLDLSRQGVIGWSMGGGGALLAAEQQPSLKALIALTPWNPGYRYAKVTTPSMMLAAMGDTLAGGQSKGFYESIPASTSKFYFETTNSSAFFGGHDTFNDPKALDGVVGRYGLSWMKVFLEGDERYRPFLKEKPPTTNNQEYLTNL